MKERIVILDDLINFRGDISKIQKELAEYPWDSEEPLANLDRKIFITVLQKFTNDIISAEMLEDWANTIECREDIFIEDEIIQGFIFELANPVINESITPKRTSKMTELLLNK